MRLFAGIAVPPGVGTMLNGRAHRVASTGLRYTTVENMHLTLYFLGQVSEPLLPPEICAAMDAVSVPQLELLVRKMGTFPRAGVLFAAVDPVPSLLDLQRGVADVLGPFAMRPDPNSPPLGEYHPHITLARTRDAQRLRSRDIAEFDEPVCFSADAVHLYQSRPTPGGSQYQVLHTIR